ncbi:MULTISPECIES: S66 peptidase family protein [Clostridium]|uniref:S66 peptidase family protein n=1 Tax=Clostridium TaxID=1485 RepID=UPI00082491F4|nr:MULTISPECIES: S66 peptidase family protein [Clostridium]PJI06908.1 LD-carboxypeptidase [Clostridium sp. CT7]
MNDLKLNKGDKVALISCSDGVKRENLKLVHKVLHSLESMNIEVEVSKCLFRKNSFFSGTGEERAEELTRLFCDHSIKAIFDISGGNSANQIISYLDFGTIKNNPKPYFGMSDLTVILNSIYEKTGIESYHYAIYNLGRDKAELQEKRFKKSFMDGCSDIFDFKCEWLRGKEISGTVIGGNIRCFLKLAGTEYFPEPENKILLLEALSGNLANISSLIEQLFMLGYFDKLSGIILGTFSEVQEEGDINILKDIILQRTKEFNIPIVKTEEIGHGSDSKCIIIGKKIKLINIDL